MELTQINSFKEFVSSPVNNREKYEVSIIINQILNSTDSNKVWLEMILDFLNNNDENKHYSQYYFPHKESDENRKGNYHLISTKEDLPTSITDEEVRILKKYNAQPQFILYEFEENSSLSSSDFASRTRTLKKVLESIGISNEVKEHLYNLIFCKVKEKILKEQQERIIEQQKSVLSKENIESLFKNRDFQYILKAVSKCNETMNSELLNLISLSAQDLLSNPNANELDKEQLTELIKKTGCYPGNLERMNYKELIDFYNNCIIKNCEEILIQIILISSKNYECFGHILEQLYNSKNSNVRLHCCGKGDYTKFLSDLSPRVAKVANIRYDFNKKWTSLSDDDIEKQRIIFLTSAVENGYIFGYESDTYLKEEETEVYFIGKLVEETSGYLIIDKDIIETINDRRIFANVINELIKQGKITLKDEMLPECFKKENKLFQEQSGLVLTKKR